MWIGAAGYLVSLLRTFNSISETLGCDCLSLVIRWTLDIGVPLIVRCDRYHVALLIGICVTLLITIEVVDSLWDFRSVACPSFTNVSSIHITAISIGLDFKSLVLSCFCIDSLVSKILRHDISLIILSIFVLLSDWFFMPSDSSSESVISCVDVDLGPASLGIQQILNWLALTVELLNDWNSLRDHCWTSYLGLRRVVLFLDMLLQERACCHLETWDLACW